MNRKSKNFVLALTCLVITCCQRNEGNTTSVLPKVTAGSYAFLSKIEEKQVPVTDSTNFDNFKLSDTLSHKQAELLNLYSLKYAGNATFFLNYKLHISKKFSTYVVSYFPNDQELYTVLINYSHNRKIISSKTIAYDEIAESFVRQYSAITKEKISTFESNSAPGETEVIKRQYSFKPNGKIE